MYDQKKPGGGSAIALLPAGASLGLGAQTGERYCMLLNTPSEFASHSFPTAPENMAEVKRNCGAETFLLVLFEVPRLYSTNYLERVHNRLGFLLVPPLSVVHIARNVSRCRHHDWTTSRCSEEWLFVLYAAPRFVLYAAPRVMIHTNSAM